MTGQQNYAAVVAVMELYVQGLYHADSTKLADVFHRDARYVNTVEGDYMNYSVSEYFDVVDRRVSPASQNGTYRDRVLSVEFGNDRMAFVKIEICLSGKKYLDFLTLYFDEGRWQIISKVFDYQPLT